MKLIIRLIIILMFNSILYGQMSEERKKELQEQYSLQERTSISALKGGLELWYFDNDTLKEPIFLPDLFLRPIWKGKIVGFIELKSKNKDYLSDNYNEINNNYFAGNNNGEFGISYMAFSFLHPVTFIDELRIGNLWLDYSRQSIYGKYSLWGGQIKSEWVKGLKSNIFYIPLSARGYVVGFQFVTDKLYEKAQFFDIGYFLNGSYEINGYYYKLNNNSTTNTLNSTEKVINFKFNNKQILENLFMTGSYAFLQFSDFITNRIDTINSGYFYDISFIFKLENFSMKYRYTFISDKFYSYSSTTYMSHPIFSADYRDFFEPIRYKVVTDISEESLYDNYFESMYYNKRFGIKFFYDTSIQKDYNLIIYGLEPAIFFYGVKYYPLFEYRRDNYIYLTSAEQIKTRRVLNNKLELGLYSSVVLQFVFRYEMENYKNIITETYIRFLRLKYKMSKDVSFELEVKESSTDNEQNVDNLWWWDSWTRFWYIDKYAFLKLKINF